MRKKQEIIDRQRHKQGDKRNSRSKVSDSIQLLENRNETLRQLREEYKVDGSLEVVCNTEKLQEARLVDLFRVARTAGHFGLVCACGVVRALEIFYLDESLSQC